MAVAALVLFGIFILLTGARAVLQRHRTGDAGSRQFSIPLASTQWWFHLRRVHAAAYDDYAARVGRFLPGIGRIHPPHQG